MLSKFINRYKNTCFSIKNRNLSKISKKVRKDEDNSKGLDKLEEQLKNGELHGMKAEELKN